MSKKPNLLRDALKNMRVAEPVRLSQARPSFKAPIETQKEAPRNEVPLSEVAPKVAPQNGPTKKEVAQSGVPDSNVTRKELPQLEGTQSNVRQNQAPQKEVAENGGSQDEAPQIEVPQEKGSDSAFFRLSHRAFSDPKLQGMSGDCFRLFLWLASKAWRYPNSDGKVRAAIRFIEEGTGMSHANVSRCLKALKGLDLVRVVQTDFKQGNVWWVSPLACPNGGGGGGKGLSRKEVPQFEAAQDQNVATSKRAGGSLKKSTEVPRFEGEIKKLRKEKKSQETFKSAFTAPSATSVAESDESYEIALSAFSTAESEAEQARHVQAYIARELPHGFHPPMVVLRRLVALNWYTRHYMSNAQVQSISA